MILLKQKKDWNEELWRLALCFLKAISPLNTGVNNCQNNNKGQCPERFSRSEKAAKATHKTGALAALTLNIYQI